MLLIICSSDNKDNKHIQYSDTQIHVPDLMYVQ